MPLHDLLTDRKTDAGTGILVPAMQSLEYHKNAIKEFRLDPDAIISNLLAMTHLAILRLLVY